ncbi:MAG: ribonuclease PH [Deltaproteobacteria bacterium HGW-Deltaproteobacteria-14]|jgi:ribonuclease PH|nr:MAG: ribonuclease PH [Deltaproteobacteria bacterium HGW-Deltaproteobacteria-14]
MSERAADALRETTITGNFTDAPLASVLVCCGATRVMCTVSVEEKVPAFREKSGGGWLTAEYAMLPGSSPYRVRRASSQGRPDGRATEIQRLVGRSLRAAFDLDRLGPRSLWIDCDVIQADGGTRTAAITGGYAAARIAVERLVHDGLTDRAAILDPVAAVSVGIVGGVPRLDLDYPLDSRADVDMNVVMTGAGRFIEVQGTGERAAFSRAELDALLGLAERGIQSLFEVQRRAIERALAAWPGVKRPAA